LYFIKPRDRHMSVQVKSNLIKKFLPALDKKRFAIMPKLFLNLMSWRIFKAFRKVS